MRAYSRKICCILALFMLITGMCFETIKADSHFVYACSDGSILTSVQQTTLTMQQKTMPEVAVLRYTQSMRQTMNSTVHSIRRDWKMACLLLGEIDVFRSLLKFCSTEVTISWVHDTVYHTVVLNYIHSLDGKKRI